MDREKILFRGKAQKMESGLLDNCFILNLLYRRKNLM